MSSTTSATRKPRLAILQKVKCSPSLADHGSNYELQTYLAGICDRVDVVMSSTDARGHYERIDNLHVHGMPGGDGVAGHLGYVLGGLAKVHELEATVKPDVYWVGDPLDSGLLARYAGLRSGRPPVLHLLGGWYNSDPTGLGWVRRRAVDALMLWTARHAGIVRPCARALGQQMTRWGIPPRKIVYIPSRVDMSRFAASEHAVAGRQVREAWGWSDKLVAVFVGSYRGAKNLGMLLDALALVRDEVPELRVALVGDGPLRPQLEAQCRALGLEDRVRLVGKVPYDEVPAYLAAGDAFVLPSRDEGLPRAAIEASAMELPIILTDVAGNADIVRDGHTGWLVQLTPDSLAAALRALGRMSAEQRRQMGRRGRAWVAPRYDLQSNVNELVYQLIERPVARYGLR